MDFLACHSVVNSGVYTHVALIIARSRHKKNLTIDGTLGRGHELLPVRRTLKRFGSLGWV